MTPRVFHCILSGTLDKAEKSWLEHASLRQRLQSAATSLQKPKASTFQGKAKASELPSCKVRGFTQKRALRSFRQHFGRRRQRQRCSGKGSNKLQASREDKSFRVSGDGTCFRTSGEAHTSSGTKRRSMYFQFNEYVLSASSPSLRVCDARAHIWLMARSLELISVISVAFPAGCAAQAQQPHV